MLRFACILVAVRLMASEPCLPVAASSISPQELRERLPVFAGASDPALPLAAAPPPGQQLSVSAAELSVWARRAGIPSSGFSSLCVVRPAQQLLKSEVEAAVRLQLPGNITIDVAAFSSNPLPPGHAVFPLSGASRPSPLRPRDPVHWSGYWETIDGKQTPIWARVSAWKMRSAVRLKGPLPARTVLCAADLEQVSTPTSAIDPSPDEVISSYVGLILKGFLPERCLLDHRQVEKPPRVVRNAMVDVHVISGQLRLELAARAESDGWVGEFVTLLSPTGRKQFRAVVQPDGSALLVVGTHNAPLRERGEYNDGSLKISN